MSEEHRTDVSGSLAVCRTVGELALLEKALGPLFVRHSEGPRHDAREQSIDGESGLKMPGLSVNPLTPESWWTRPLEHWIARQLVQYRQLQRIGGRKFAWVLTGREVGRGPDNEPLLAEVAPLAILRSDVLDESEALYAEVFQRGRVPR